MTDESLQRSPARLVRNSKTRKRFRILPRSFSHPKLDEQLWTYLCAQLNRHEKLPT